jgi:hypothetical protein
MPSIIEDLRSQPVSLGRKDPFFIYLNYGDPSNQSQFDQAFASVNISSTGINLVSNNIYEIKRAEINNTSCSANTVGTEYPISFDLVQNNTLQYGFGSASVVGQASGTKSATLNAKQTGCLKIGLKVMPTAKQGDEVTIIYKQLYINTEGVITSVPEIPEKTIQLAIGASPVCSADQVIVGTRCLTVCKDTEYRVSSGDCAAKQTTCSTGQELVAEKCVPPCGLTEARNTFGECKKSSQDYSAVISMVVASILGVVALIVILVIIYSLTRTLRKRL